MILKSSNCLVLNTVNIIKSLKLILDIVNNSTSLLDQSSLDLLTVQIETIEEIQAKLPKIILKIIKDDYL